MKNEIYYKIYSDAVAPDTVAKNSRLNNVSLALKILAALAFVLSFVVSLWLLVPTLLLLTGGVLLRQIYLSGVASFVYTVSNDGLYVGKISVLGDEKPLAKVSFSDVIAFSDSAEKSELVSDFVVNATDKTEFSTIFYVFEQKNVALKFSPDDYMTALIKKQMKLFKE